MRAVLFVFVFVRVDEGLEADVQELSSLAPSLHLQAHLLLKHFRGRTIMTIK